MVSTLSHIKSLRLIDWNTSSMLRNKKVSTVELARDFSVRYFIEGQVRKFGDQIKISITLLDIESGDHLWQDSLKGTMEDIFDIQEQCSAMVVAGLELHLSKEEKVKVRGNPTRDAEAYELFLKASEYFNRNTHSDFERALSLYEEAARRDPSFSTVYGSIARSSQALYRFYTPSEAHLARAESAAARLRELAGETAEYFSVMSHLSLLRGDYEAAMRLALRAVEVDPEYTGGYDVLAWVYRTLGKRAEAAQACEEAVRRQGDSPVRHYNFLTSLRDVGDSPEAKERLRQAAEQVIVIFERHVRLNPDDYGARAQLAIVFQMADREADALTEAEILAAMQTLDANALYNLACLYLHCRQPDRGMSILRRSTESGYSDFQNMQNDPDLDPLRGRPDFQELMKSLEEKRDG
jgi:adenylate cyclase